MRTEIININKKLEPHLNYNKKVENALDRAKKQKKVVKKSNPKGKVVASKTTKNKGGNVSQTVIVNVGKKKSSTKTIPQPVRTKPQPQFNINPVINIPEFKMTPPPPPFYPEQSKIYNEMMIKDFSTNIPRTTIPLSEFENTYTYKLMPSLPISRSSYPTQIQSEEGEITIPRSSQSIYIPVESITERTPMTTTDVINSQSGAGLGKTKKVKPVKETTPFGVSFFTEPIQQEISILPSSSQPTKKPKPSQTHLPSTRPKLKKEIMPEIPSIPLPELPITYTPILQEEESNIRTPIGLVLPISETKKQSGEKITDFYSSTGGSVKKPPSSRKLYLPVESTEPVLIESQIEQPELVKEEISIPKKSRKLIDERGRPTQIETPSFESFQEREEARKAKRRSQYHKSKGRTQEEIRQREEKKYGITNAPSEDYVPIEYARRESEAKQLNPKYNSPFGRRQQEEGEEIPIIPKNNRTLVKSPPPSKNY